MGALGSAGAAALAGCGGSSDSRGKTEEDPEVIHADEIDWMDRGDMTYAELAENSAQMHVGDYNRDMEMTGQHIDSAPELGPTDSKLIDEDSVELYFTPEESEGPGERVSAELRMKTNDESVLSDFSEYEGQEDLYEERVGQLFGSVMMPTVGTLFTDNIGPDFGASEASPDENAVTGIDYVLEDSKGNEERISYDTSEVDQLSGTYDEVMNQKEAFYEEAMEAI